MPPPVTDPPTPVTTFSEIALTNPASVQVVPFSFLSLRLTPGWTYRPSMKNVNGDKTLYTSAPKFADFLSRRVFTAGLTGGFGVNPNSGTADPEYFAGVYGSVDRFMVHFGLDEGYLQTLGGDFSLGDVVPAGTTVPTNRHLVGKVAGAVSVRLYP
jgi:hypothetical protein